MCCGKRFPIQAEHKYGGKPATTIDWHEAESIYEDYAFLFGRRQSLERLAERGGFGHNEAAVIRREASEERARQATLTTRWHP